MRKSLTIIIPTYNMERYLEKCLSSLVADEKTMESLEALVVIDGATDGSEAIAQKFQAQHPETFRVISKENGNYGSCINRGLQEASGKYVKILDADDSFDTASLEKLVDFLGRTDVDLVITDYRKVGEDGNVLDTPHFYTTAGKDLAFSAIKPKLSMEMHMVTYKTENLRHIGYRQTEKVSYTDQEWIFAPMISVSTLQYLDIVLYNYLWGREGQTMDPAVAAKSQAQLMKVCMAMAHTFESLDTDSIHRAYLQERLHKNLLRIYRNFLLRCIVSDISPLVDFDAELMHASPTMYKVTGSYMLNHVFPYVKLWRLFKYKHTPALLRKIYTGCKSVRNLK
ncbi:glycosyltransferase family 2 protein [Fibrobacter sp. UBA4309]|uniref:glycosyltransferase family 2 protein n=1 Tax=Fibrobacter sp. UBA4309 TaxID=1946537 RepID=UPI0025BF4243|nr:glycosyltransferase family A protein [Fibrobacter sp. UBA4309]